MKVFIHYEDNDDLDLHKSLKLTLPKSWKNGPVSKLLKQFVETYNSNERLGAKNELVESELHLGIKLEKDGSQTATSNSSRTNMGSLANDEKSEINNDDDDASNIKVFASDAITLDVLNDRDSVFVYHGPSQTLDEILALQEEEEMERRKMLASTVSCVRLGCTRRFNKEGPYPTNCQFHKSPPVFHETAKFWSCCPNKKAYDWDEFQSIPGCKSLPHCTHLKDESDTNEKLFLGGCDMRGQTNDFATKLKSIEDFNNDNSGKNTVLDGFRSTMNELDIENELIDQVLHGLKKEAGINEVGDNNDAEDPAKMKIVQELLAKEMKSALKSIAAEQLRIKS